jgi:hypothetical protein
MDSNAILHEVQQLYNVSDQRLPDYFFRVRI